MQGYIPPRLIADAAAVLAHWLALTAMPVLVAWVRYVATWHRWLDVALREVLFERWLSPPIERFVMQWLGTAAAAAMRDDGKQRADDDDTATSTPPRTSSLTSPRHIAFIMDGNRRFARRRHWTSSFRGHLAGFRKLEQVGACHV